MLSDVNGRGEGGGGLFRRVERGIDSVATVVR